MSKQELLERGVLGGTMSETITYADVQFMKALRKNTSNPRQGKCLCSPFLHVRPQTQGSSPTMTGPFSLLSSPPLSSSLLPSPPPLLSFPRVRRGWGSHL